MITVTSSAKGAARERELVNRFHAAGWGALRLGASGSGGDADLPDVLAGQGMVVSQMGMTITATETWAVELKSGRATTLYVGQKEVDDLLRFAESWGAKALLGARFTTQASPTDTYLVGIEDARRTDGGAYGLPVEDIAERAFAVVSEDGVKRL